MGTVVLPDAAAVAVAVADLIQREIAAPAATLGLAGGSTPRAAYELLPAMGLDWSHTTLWLSDERWVAPTDPASNERMVREAFVDQVGAHLVAPDHSSHDPREAADRYSATLRTSFGTRGPDLVLLGLGDDGHTASLFPGTDALAAEGERFVANWVPEKNAWRLTATLELLWAARELVFVVAGAGKADALLTVVKRGVPLPARRVATGAARVTWLVDEAAAANLT